MSTPIPVGTTIYFPTAGVSYGGTRIFEGSRAKVVRQPEGEFPNDPRAAYYGVHLDSGNGMYVSVLREQFEVDDCVIQVPSASMLPADASTSTLSGVPRTGADASAFAYTHGAMSRVFTKALEQSAEGKGKERHGFGNEPIEKQLIVEIGNRLGSNHWELGQAVKKSYESAQLNRLGRKEAALAEILGAINYLGAAYLQLKKA